MSGGRSTSSTDAYILVIITMAIILTNTSGGRSTSRRRTPGILVIIIMVIIMTDMSGGRSTSRRRTPTSRRRRHN